MEKKGQDRKSKRTRQKNKSGDRKGESNDSPEIPDMGKNIRHPQPPFGAPLPNIPMPCSELSLRSIQHINTNLNRYAENLEWMDM